MAAWQADFDVVLPPAGLPQDYRPRLSELLPPGSSWADDLEVWGSEDGDRIDVLSAASQSPEVFARFDMRIWRPSLYDAFLRFVQSVDGRIQAAESKVAIPATMEEFERALRESRAARFVQDPEAYLRSLMDNPIRMRDEP